MSRNRPNSMRPLTCQQLEGRLMMAADAQLVEGVVEIQGTNNADVIEVDDVVIRQLQRTRQGLRFVNVPKIQVRIEDTSGNLLELARFDPRAVDQLVIEALGGNDRVSNNTDKPAVIQGGAGNDNLTGGSANDVIVGGDGNDELWGMEGDDVLRGRSGHDTIFGGVGEDILLGEAGNDHLFGGIGNDRLDGGAGDDVLAGDEGDDDLFGGSGDDLLQGGADNDVLWGEEGYDWLLGNSGNDILFGGADRDVMSGNTGSDELYFDWSDSVDGWAGFLLIFEPQIIFGPYKGTQRYDG